MVNRPSEAKEPSARFSLVFFLTSLQELTRQSSRKNNPRRSVFGCEPSKLCTPEYCSGSFQTEGIRASNFAKNERKDSGSKDVDQWN